MKEFWRKYGMVQLHMVRSVRRELANTIQGAVDEVVSVMVCNLCV